MESIEHRALKIAAKIMVAAELCRYNDRGECHLYCQGVADCDKCVEQWLRNKARKELFEESSQRASQVESVFRGMTVPIGAPERRN